MKTKKEIDELLNSSKEPEGITVRSSDGKMFFIPKEDAQRLAIPSTALNTAYYFSSFYHQSHPKGEDDISDEECSRIKVWLDTHGPDTLRWRAVCLYYFVGSGCV